MKHLFLLLLVVFVTGCQNQNKKSVHEKTFIELGGEEQYVEMTGASDDLPVLLFLHGGPGWPQNPQLRYFNSDLTKEMILVSWDQAGCGRSFMKNPNPENLSPESLVNDAHELTQWLKKKFNKRKIFLLGFSYGSVIGLSLAEKYPEDYYAYIGVDQIIDMQKSWDVSMQWLNEQAQMKQDSATLSQLQLIENKDTSVCGTVLDCFMSKYQLLLNYNGVVYDSAISKEIEKAETMFDDYMDYNWYDAFNYTAARMEGEPFITNISHIKDLDIPVYFMAGRHDWNLPGIVAEQHLSKMNAPEKTFIWFEKSGHEIPAEESEKFNQTIINIVKEKSQ
ncbi:MAG: alpha/beta hydrolase [Bacteroidales bacterium]|nr:alpha/beta hydrolase [Bacteroidales bacterium]